MDAIGFAQDLRENVTSGTANARAGYRAVQDNVLGHFVVADHSRVERLGSHPPVADSKRSEPRVARMVVKREAHCSKCR